MKSGKIIAILGLPGSGKSEMTKYLLEKHQWPYVYFGEVTFDEMKKRGLEINEKNEKTVREGLRKKFGKLHYARQVIKKIKKIKNERNILVGSLYTWEEYLEFKKVFGEKFKAVAVYASPKVRYLRLKARKSRPLNQKEAQNRDYSQIENLAQGGPIAMADFIIVNEGTKKELKNNIDKIINKLK